MSIRMKVFWRGRKVSLNPFSLCSKEDRFKPGQRTVASQVCALNFEILLRQANRQSYIII